MNAARTLGWVANQVDAKLFKRQLLRVAKRIGPSIRSMVVPDPDNPPVAGKWMGSPAAAIAETEWNDSEAYADDIGTIFSFKTTVTGSILSSGDADFFRFNVLYEGELTIATTSPTLVPLIQLSDSNGDFIWGYHYWASGNTKIKLPAGTYHIALGAGGATTYSCDLTFKSTQIPTLVFGKAATASLTSSHVEGFRIVVAKEGRVRLAIASNNGSDTWLVLQNGSWGFVYDSDNWNSQSGSTEAGLDILLPPGTYYVYIGGDQSDTASVTATFTAATIPVLGSTPVNGHLNYSDGSYDLLRFILTKTETVTVNVNTRNGSAGTTDTYCQILDANLRSMAESWENSTSWFSTFELTLPPGTYYVSSGAYWDYGDYLASLARSAAAITAAVAGYNAVTLGTDKSATLSFSLLTPSPVEINLVDGTNFDGQMSILNVKTGLTYTWEEDEYVSNQHCSLGVNLPAGDYFIHVKDYDGTAGSCVVNIMTPLHRFTGNILGYQGKAGSLLYFVVGITQVPAYNPLVGIISGNLLISLAPPTLLLTAPLGATGRINFGASLPPGGGLILQSVEINLAKGKGFYTNLLK